MRYLIFLCLVIISFSLLGQNSNSALVMEKDSSWHTKVDTMPRTAKVFNIQVAYPENERELGIEGTVSIGYVIEKDGTLDSIRIVKGVDQGLNSSALRVVNSLPKKWIPGILNGEPVRVQCIVPIRFKLN